MPSVSLVLPENIFSVSLEAREGFPMLRWYRSQEELGQFLRTDPVMVSLGFALDA